MIAGTLIGAAAGLLWLYGLRPNIPYPWWMLQSFQHPWVFLVMLVVVLYVATWSPVLAVMLFLLVAALLMDMILYASPAATAAMAAPGHVATQRVLPAPHNMYTVHDEERDDGLPSPYEADAARMSGITLSSVALPEPHYPTFYGLRAEQPGEPAPF